MSNLFRKKEAALILLTIALSLVFYLRSLKPFLTHFLDHLETHSDRQYGSRCTKSTGDIHSYLTDLWFFALRNYGETCVVALDIFKAFDRVKHASLLSKFSSFGFPTSLCLLMSSFLSNRSISAVVDEVTSSSSFSVNSGV